jgi:hypothetical protein
MILTTDIHAAGGIRTHITRKAAAEDRRLRPSGQWEWQLQCGGVFGSFEFKLPSANFFFCLSFQLHRLSSENAMAAGTFGLEEKLCIVRGVKFDGCVLKLCILRLVRFDICVLKVCVVRVVRFDRCVREMCIVHVARFDRCVLK